MEFDFQQPEAGVSEIQTIVNAHDDELTSIKSSLEALASYYTTIPREGMSKAKRLALEAIAPTQFESIELGRFTNHDSKNGVSLALEAITGGMVALISAAVVAVMALLYKLIKWIFGRSETTNKVAEATANKAASTEAKSETKEEIKKHVETPAGKAELDKVIHSAEQEIAKDLSQKTYSINPFAYDVITATKVIGQVQALAKDVSKVLDLSHHGMRFIGGFVAKAATLKPNEKFTVNEELAFQKALIEYDNKIGVVLHSVSPLIKFFAKEEPPKDITDIDAFSHYPQKMTQGVNAWIHDEMTPLTARHFEDIANNCQDAVERVSELLRSKEEYAKVLLAIQGFNLQNKDGVVFRHLQQRPDGGSVFNPRGALLKDTTPEVIARQTNFIKVSAWMSGGHDMLVTALIRKVGSALQTAEQYYTDELKKIEEGIEQVKQPEIKEELKQALTKAKKELLKSRTKYDTKYASIIEKGINSTTVLTPTELAKMDDDVQKKMTAMTSTAPTFNDNDDGGAVIM